MSFDSIDLLPAPMSKEDWIIDAQTKTYNLIKTGVLSILASIQDLSNAVNQLATVDHELADGLGTLGANVQRLVADFEQIKSSGVLTTEQQQMIDQSLQTITDTTTQLAQQAAAASTSSQSIDTADPQPAPPAGGGAQHQTHSRTISHPQGQ